MPPPDPQADPQADLRPEPQPKPLFDAYLMADWSSKSTPARGADSIWLARAERHGDELRETWVNPPTRAEALARLREALIRLVDSGRRCLVGFDFGLGYPAGFAQALGLAGTPWQAVYSLLSELVEDDARNRHNRDAVAAELNRRIGGGGPGPFWGCPTGRAGPLLTIRRLGHCDFRFQGLAEWRACDRAARRVATVQSVWKLSQGVAVGGQTLLGITTIEALRSDPRLAGQIAVWPLETGWARGDAPLVICEAFPSIVPLDPSLGAVKDLAQVRTLARHCAALDEQGELEASFGRPPGLSEAESQAALREESWILLA